MATQDHTGAIGYTRPAWTSGLLPGLEADAMRRLLITNRDGQTRVLDAETGKDCGLPISRVKLEADADNPPRVVLELATVDVEVEGDFQPPAQASGTLTLNGKTFPAALVNGKLCLLADQPLQPFERAEAERAAYGGGMKVVRTPAYRKGKPA